MTDNQEPLNERDSLLAALLSRGVSKTQAAREVGCSRTVVSNLWNNDDAFRREVRRLSRDRIERGERRIANLLDQAIDELRELLASEDDAVRLRTVQLIVSRCESLADGQIRNDLDELLRWREEAKTGMP